MFYDYVNKFMTIKIVKIKEHNVYSPLNTILIDLNRNIFEFRKPRHDWDIME